MSVQMVQQRLDAYQCKTALEEEHAIREITQEIVLAALSRSAFFRHALFQGGTCLRIFHGLNRFSEDLDFILSEPDPAKCCTIMGPVKVQHFEIGRAHV